MLQPLSQTEKAFRDTLLAKAEGTALDRLSDLYGVPRIFALPLLYWRRVLAAAALGPRDRMGTIFEVLRALLEPWTEQTLTFCDLEAATPAKLIGGTPAGNAWSCAHEGRLIEVDGDVYWSVGVDGSDLDLATTTTTYWRAANWASDRSNVSVRVLPFWMREDGAQVKIYLDADLLSTPPTYLLPNSVDARPAGQPIGGALLQDASVVAEYEGPVYLIGEGLAGLFKALLDNLCAAGVNLNMYTFIWCSDNALDAGSFLDFSLYGRVSAGGAPTPLSLEGWDG